LIRFPVSIGDERLGSPGHWIFVTKVVVNGGRNGRYYAVDDFAEAQTRWPDLKWCG